MNIARICLYTATFTILCVVAASNTFADQSNGYNISARFLLTASQHGIEGEILLQQDSSLISNNANDYIETEKTPKNAILKIVDSSGKTVETNELSKPFAGLVVHRIDNEDVFFLTVDLSIGFGSYAGSTTQIFKIENSQLLWQFSKESNGDTNEKITLKNTLKSGWKIDTKDNKTNIYQVSCRPNFSGSFAGNQDFIVTYETYLYSGNIWLKKQRDEISFWENDRGFPSLVLFPRIN